MKLLLDTHVALWWLAADPRLSPVARAAITQPHNTIMASVISAFEIGTKVRIGKMDSPIAREFPVLLSKSGIPALSLDLAHMVEGAALAWTNRDPWDRLLAAQAMVEGCGLVSSDKAFRALPIQVVW